MNNEPQGIGLSQIRLLEATYDPASLKFCGKRKTPRNVVGVEVCTGVNHFQFRLPIRRLGRLRRFGAKSRLGDQLKQKREWPEKSLEQPAPARLHEAPLRPVAELQKCFRDTIAV